MSKSQGQNNKNKNSSLVKRWNADTEGIRIVKKPTSTGAKSTTKRKK